MKANRFVTRTLLIRENEWNVVNRLFSFEFFQGISIAIFFYCSITLFLDHLPTNDLAYAFVISSLFLWISGAFYSKMEHKLDTKHLILMTVLVNAALILFTRIGLMFNEPVWFYYLMLAGFNVAYLLNNLEFWGSAALLFDVRQSKRLFSIISAGDIPAKLVGYLASAFLGKMIGQEDLLWIAFASLMVSLYFYRRLIATGAFDQHNHHHGNHHAHHEHAPNHTPHEHPEHSTHHAGHEHHDRHEHHEQHQQHRSWPVEHMNPTAESAIHLIRKNPLIRQAALISFFSYSAFILLTFLFFGYIKKTAAHLNESLALYIAIFLAASRGITLLFKLMVTNRLADNLGIRASLLITPALLFIMSLFLMPASLYASMSTVFYGFATITITLDVMRAAIQSPVLLAAMQPLPVHERLSGHTIIKGITDPFAFFTIGLAISLLFIWYPEVDYRVMSVFLFLLIICYAVSVLRFGKIYHDSLQRAIKNRTIQEREISITDRESIRIMLNKIAEGAAGEAVLALNLARDLPMDTRLQFLRSAVKNESPLVQLKAVVLARQWNATGFLPELRILVSRASDQHVLVAAIAALAEMDEHYNSSTFLHHPNVNVVAATIAESVKRSDACRLQSIEILQSWSQSSDAQLREKAAGVMGEAHDEALHLLLVPLLTDSDPKVRHAAIVAAGKQKSRAATLELLRQVAAPEWQSKIIDALQSAGESAVAGIKTFILKSSDEALQKKLILLLGRIGGEVAGSALDELAAEIPHMTEVLFRAMGHCGFRASPDNKHRYHRLCRENLNSAAYITYLVRFLERAKADETLIRAFESELLMIRERMLQLFGFLFDATSIRKVRAGFELGTKESVSNALEIISVSVAREFSREFIALFEMESYDQKCSLLEDVHPEPEMNYTVIAHEVFRDVHHQYHSWTKSVVMYFMHKEIRPDVRKAAEVFRSSTDPLLKQTADWMFESTTMAGT